MCFHCDLPKEDRLPCQLSLVITESVCFQKKKK